MTNGKSKIIKSPLKMCSPTKKLSEGAKAKFPAKQVTKKMATMPKRRR